MKIFSRGIQRISVTTTSRSIHTGRLLSGEKPYNWYFDQLKRDEEEKKFNEWLATQPLLPPPRISGHQRPKCYFDYATQLTRDEEDMKDTEEEETIIPIGRVVFELCDDYLPETCKNFMELCEGKRLSYDPEQPATFKNTKVDQVLKDKFICGGLTEIPVYPFDDEGFIIRQRKGILGMNAGGVHQNTSHFYILLMDSFHLQGHNVAFGAIVEGFEVVQEIGDGLAYRGKLLTDVIIQDCGVLREN